MSHPYDRRVHADALRRHSRLNQTQRFKRQMVILLVSVALGGIAYPSLLLDRPTVEATGTYLRAKAKILLVSGAIADAPLQISYDGREYEASARSVAAHPYYRGAAHATLTLIVRGCWLGFVAWLLGLLLLRGAARRRREWALRDRVIAGTLVVE